ncbi:MAG TPA: polysaccharide deacetylase family protein [Polyangia bacterium]|jgi:peptidoglycan/xylan/chitin deacetylase (PgdA/CDA1 family)|nr:polysaccharide deacetylase family protein [Polyangia bacterium]
MDHFKRRDIRALLVTAAVVGAGAAACGSSETIYEYVDGSPATGDVGQPSGTGGCAGAAVGDGCGGSDGGGLGGGGDAGGPGSGGAGGGAGSGGADGGPPPGGNDGPPAGIDKGGPDSPVVIGPLGGNGCAGGTCANPTCQPLGAPAAIGDFPELGYEDRPSYIPNDVIIPTFDDTPDSTGSGNWTSLGMRFFANNDMHVDYFINTDNYCGPILADPGCSATLQEMLRLHNPANHTVHHVHMGANMPPKNNVPQSCGGPISGVTCEVELAGVEMTINTASGGDRPHLTRFRPPYGQPYSPPGPTLAAVQASVAKFAVAVGWSVDSGDSSGGPFTGRQIADNVINEIGSGPGAKSWGVVLMHGTFRWTYEALSILFDKNSGYLKTHGFRLATVEDAICWKYGKHSWQIISELTRQERSPN